MPRQIDYYLSLMSPWTYLGSARFEAMAARHGATVTVWPVDFGQIFAASGGLPLGKRAPQRQAYRMMELKRWRAHLGVPIKLEPKFFPGNELPAARAVIAVREQQGSASAMKLAHAVLRGVWEQDANVADPQTLAAIIASTGLDAKQVLAWSEASTSLKGARPIPVVPSSMASSALQPLSLMARSSGVRTGLILSSASSRPERTPQLRFR